MKSNSHRFAMYFCALCEIVFFFCDLCLFVDCKLYEDFRTDPEKCPFLKIHSTIITLKSSKGFMQNSIAFLF